MIQEKGNISIHTENIFPIIKKWLYSEKDIFLRELVSNASDAISKLRKLSDIGEAKLSDDYKPRIDVLVNKEKGTISIIDNGIGMTEEEVKKYINQIAFSGAKDFIEKYKDKTDDQQIIGHFGLGFYSSFMVSQKVTIDTLSYKQDAQPVQWESDGDTQYAMDASAKTTVGTTVTLNLAEDSKEFLDSWKVRETLKKYFAFLQYEIYVTDENEKPEDKPEGDSEAAEKTEVTPINNIAPLWLKNPKDCSDEEYKKFYHEVFTDFNDPLFWIHINMDYPFNMKGIIYFPKLRHEFDTMEGKIKLFYNQVFVADNIKEVIPEFLLLLKGCLDCPDLPLNVSRSFLQNEGYVNKISAHITKKVADKLQLLFKKDRESYEKYWEDINPFVKYGCMREEKFYDKVKDILVYKTIHDKHVTMPEYLEAAQDKDSKKVYYVTDEKQQAQYIRMFKEHQMDAVILSTLIDSHFVSFMESHNHEVKFLRVDSDITGSFKDSEKALGEEEKKILKERFEKIFREATGNEKLNVDVENLKSTSTPAVIVVSEQSRRFREMSRSFGGGFNAKDLFPDEETLIINQNSPITGKILDLYGDSGRKDDALLAANYVNDLAAMSHKQLEPDRMLQFIERSNTILSKIMA